MRLRRREHGGSVTLGSNNRYTIIETREREFRTRPMELYTIILVLGRQTDRHTRDETCAKETFRQYHYSSFSGAYICITLLPPLGRAGLVSIIIWWSMYTLGVAVISNWNEGLTSGFGRFDSNTKWCFNKWLLVSVRLWFIIITQCL